MLPCSQATALTVRLADQGTVLVTSGGAERALWAGSVTRRHVAWATARAAALRAAEVSGQALDANRLLVTLASGGRVAIVGRVGGNLETVPRDL